MTDKERTLQTINVLLRSLNKVESISKESGMSPCEFFKEYLEEDIDSIGDDVKEFNDDSMSIKFKEVEEMIRILKTKK